MSRFPVGAIGRIRHRQGYGDTASYENIPRDEYEIEDAKAGFIFRREGFEETTRYSQYIVQHQTRFRNPDWEVKYRAGYVLDETDSGYMLTDPDPETGTYGQDLSITSDATDKGPALPADLKRAALQIVKTWGLTLQDDPSVFQEKVGDASETRWNTITGLGPNIMGILDRYKIFFYGC